MNHRFSSTAPIIRWFDEDRYLLANPDVAQAVRDGILESGQQHYVNFGFAEERSLGLPSRHDRLLSGINILMQQGMEIGALMTPVVSKLEANVLFVDHTDTATLRKKYHGDPNVDPDRIVIVDVVWNHGPLRGVLPKDFRADYVIASHVIEHVPDMIRWLEYIREILTPNTGMLRLAIPDRRFTFDILRVETRLHDLLHAYLRKSTVPAPDVVLDHCTHFRKVDTQLAWRGMIDLDNLDHLFSPTDYLSIAKRALDGEYLDVHCWVFTPYSFANLMKQACDIGLVHLACTDFHFGQPFENEFIVGLRSCDDDHEAAASWKLMMEASEAQNS